MKMVIIGFAAVAVSVLTFIVLRGFYNGARYVVAAGVGAARQGNGFSVSGIGPQTYGPYTIHGTIVMDTENGIPAVPFIQYLDTHNAISTKQLVYYDARACAPAAGDIPCAPTYSASDGYPSLSGGERVTATGYIYEDRFLVTSINTNS